MTKQELARRLEENQAWIQGKRIKLDFGEAGTLMLDGVNGRVSDEAAPPDTAIRIAWSDWQALASGQMDGMSAFITGKLKVEGDMGNALQLSSILSRLKDSSSRS